MNALENQIRRAPCLALACLLAGALPAVSQGAPDYSAFSASVCIPFANPQSVPFTDPPKLRFSVSGGSVKTVTMDTGSVGIALAYDQIPNYKRLKVDPDAKPGYQFLSSSKILWKGTWVRTAVTFYDGSTPVATSLVPVLGVEQEVVCQSYSGGGTCGNIPLHSAKGREIAYMGVGFGREEDHQPQGTPDKNPLLNLNTIAGRAVAGVFNRGYIIGSTGVTVGLTSVNTRGFSFIKLIPSNEYSGDWMPASMCVQINGSPCSPGSVLVDTGIPQSYVTVPSSVQFETVQVRDPSDRSKTVGVLASGTVVAVNLPGLPNPVAVDSFTVGQHAPVEPLLVIPFRSDTRKPFVNTGRHFLRQFQFLYDARNGYVGLKPRADGCGG
jgi:hypothetical protein